MPSPNPENFTPSRLANSPNPTPPPPSRAPRKSAPTIPPTALAPTANRWRLEVLRAEGLECSVRSEQLLDTLSGAPTPNGAPVGFPGACVLGGQGWFPTCFDHQALTKKRTQRRSTIFRPGATSKVAPPNHDFQPNGPLLQFTPR